MEAQEALEKILTQFHQNVGPLIRIVVTYSFHIIYRKTFDCTWSSPQSCWVYLLLPCLVIWVLLLILDKRFHQSCSKFFIDTSSRRVSVGTAVIRLLVCLCVSLIWAVLVLVDGDWFVCCGPHESPPVCKTPGQCTPEEKNNTERLKMTSWNIGMSVLVVMAMIVLITFLIKGCLKDLALYEVLLEEEDSVVLKRVREAFTNKADQELKAHIERGEWRECYDKGQEVFRWKPSGNQGPPEILRAGTSPDSTSAVTSQNTEEDTSVAKGDSSHDGTADVRRRPTNHKNRTTTRKQNGRMCPSVMQKQESESSMSSDGEHHSKSVHDASPESSNNKESLLQRKSRATKTNGFSKVTNGS